MIELTKWSMNKQRTSLKLAYFSFSIDYPIYSSSNIFSSGMKFLRSTLNYTTYDTGCTYWTVAKELAIKSCENEEYDDGIYDNEL